MEEWADRAAKDSSQEEHLLISASGICSTAMAVGGSNIKGDSSCNSQRLGSVEGILCVVGNSFGEKSLDHAFSTRGGGQGADILPALGWGPCWYRPRVLSMTRLVSLRVGHCRCNLLCFFLNSDFLSRWLWKGPSDLGREEETFISCLSSMVCDNIRFISSWYAEVRASLSCSPDRLWNEA